MKFFQLFSSKMAFFIGFFEEILIVSVSENKIAKLELSQKQTRDKYERLEQHQQLLVSCKCQRHLMLREKREGEFT
jgi:hypothetical protein